MNTYTDRYLRDRVQNAIKAQTQGKLLVDSSHTGLCLPCKEDLGERIVRALYPHDYQVGDKGFLDYDRDTGMYIYTAKPGGAIPAILAKCPKLVLGEAIVDIPSKTIRIQNGEELITFTSVPVWEPGYVLMREVNEELTRLQTGLVIWKIDWSESANDVVGPLPKVINAHAVATLTGYAIDPDTRSLIYLGCVGYKTSLESLRASLITNKPLNLVCFRQNDLTMLPEDRYEVLWQAMPEYTSHHACFICRTALPGKWEPEDPLGYLVVFDGGFKENALEAAFVDRLIETLNIPVQPSWAHTLWRAAIEQHFATRLDTWGDCLAAAKIDLQANWQQLIETLLASGELTID